MRTMIQNIKETILENKKKSIIIIIILLILLLLILWPKEDDKNKIYTASRYVITYESTKIDKAVSKLPYINLKGEDINIVNNAIMIKYYECEELEDRYMDYEYYSNDKVLSLIVKVYLLEDDFIPSEIEFYNFDMNGKRLTNNDLKELYNVDDTLVEESLNTQVKKYYNYEVQKGYINKNTCDYNCYIKLYPSDYLNTLEYYVKNNSLYTYFYFNIDSNFAYDSNKPFDIFRFKIK